jgi:hypothetical protein
VPKRALAYPLLAFLLLCEGAWGAGQKPYVTPLISTPEWTLVASQKVSLQDLGPYGCQVPVDQEFGAHSALERTYGRAGIEVNVFVEEASDPSAAYGLFTFYQNPAMQSVSGVDLVRIGPHTILMARNRYFIRVVRQPGLSPIDLHSLLAAIGGARLSAIDRERLPTILHGRGFVAGSQKYLLGPEAMERVLPSFPVGLIGFEDGVEAQLGTYRGEPGPMKLLLISYPTPQIAEMRYKTIQSRLSVDHRLGNDSAYGRQQASYVILALDATSKSAAGRLLNEVKVTEWVSRMPAYHPADTMARDMMLLVVENIELVFVIAVLGVAGGILLFFGKRLITNRFPDSWFSRQQDERLIRLRLR